jgi:hypothetical protein
MTNQYFWDRLAPRNPGLRAADADRERTAERLRSGHAEGRLDMAEFQERLERCYEAKTYGELEELVTDLPRQDSQVNRSSLRPWRWPLAPVTTVLIALIVLASLTPHHHGHFFWLWIPVVFFVWRMAWWRRRRWWAGAPRG